MVSILETVALVLEEMERVFVEFIHLLFKYGVNRGTKTCYMGEGGN